MEIIETKKDAKARSLLDFAPLRPIVLIKLSIYFARYGKWSFFTEPAEFPLAS